jgi:hypothetical protein
VGRSIAEMAQQIVVSLFDLTGNMVLPWAKAGFLCYCVDIQHPSGEQREGNIIRVGADVREWLPPFGPIKILFAFPPCTHVAVSGARWFQDKGLGALIDSLDLFDAAVHRFRRFAFIGVPGNLHIHIRVNTAPRKARNVRNVPIR